MIFFVIFQNARLNKEGTAHKGVVCPHIAVAVEGAVGEAWDLFLHSLQQTVGKTVHIFDGVVPTQAHTQSTVDLLVRQTHRGKHRTLCPFGARRAAGNIDIPLREKMQHRHHFATNDEAFDAAVAALKGVLNQNGYTEKDGGFEKR